MLSLARIIRLTCGAQEGEAITRCFSAERDAFREKCRRLGSGEIRFFDIWRVSTAIC
jgi:hypothetical protein